MESMIAHGIAVAFTGIMISIFAYLIAKKNANELIKNIKEEHIVLKLPKLYAIIGLLGVIYSIVVYLISTPESRDSWAVICYGMFILLCMFLIIEQFVWRIDVYRSEDYFIYRSAFGKVRKIEYKECLWFYEKTNTVILKTENKTYYIDNKACNLEFLTATMVKNKVPKKNELIKNSKEEHIVLKLPKYYAIIGLLCAIAFIAFNFIATTEGEDIWTIICFRVFIGVFILFSMFLIIEQFVWRIDVYRSEDYFIYRSAFGKVRKIKYKECWWFYETANTVILKTANKTYYINNKARNIECLIAMMVKNRVYKKTEFKNAISFIVNLFGNFQNRK